MNYKKIKYIILFFPIFSLFIVISPYLVSAQNPFNSNMINALTNRVYNTANTGNPEDIFIQTLSTIIFMLISFLGIVFILLIMYGGYIWMNAKGNESNVEKAQHIIRDAVIGLVVLGASYGVWILVYSLLFGEWVLT